MKRVIVLGGGLVGSVIARALAHDPQLAVTVADASPQVRESLARSYGLPTMAVDVAHSEALAKAIAPADLVIGAVPGFLGYRMLETVIRAGKDVVDISFCPEDPLALQDLALEHGVTAVVDAGLCPGLSNLVLGHYAAEYDEVTGFVCYVGGLPQERHPPFEYQAVFSPIDVIEEYTRPARLRRDGRDVTLPALSEIELLDLPQVGRVEAFNTDGLRTLLATTAVPNMVEKTVRYPGHAEKMRLLREAGFFSAEPLDIAGHPVAPLEVTSRLLFEAWRPQGDGRDLVVMRIVITGLYQGEEVTTTVDLFDRYDPATATTAMARTTGYSCAALARYILGGGQLPCGILPLELLGGDTTVYGFIRDYLQRQGISLELTRVPAR